MRSHSLFARGDRKRIRDRACAAAAIGAAALLTVLGLAATPDAARSAEPETPLAHAQYLLAKTGKTTCDAGVTASDPEPRQVNLVLDDSGSMFRNDDGSSSTSWSAAKYSVEVFASMLGERDTLNVYRTSDFAGGASAGPAVQISGGAPLSDRIGRVHGMQLAGGGTPYAPVAQAVTDLVAGSANDKWLVVLSDGEFDDRATAEVQADLVRYVAENRSETSGLRVAFLALGSSAPMLGDDPAAGVHFSHSPDSSTLLGMMTEFSNRIFGRSLVPQSPPGQANIDIDMDEIMVFAQGAGVDIESLETSDGSIRASSIADISWAQNQPASSDGTKVPAEPDTSLEGKLAVFENVPAGSIAVKATGAKKIDLFYQPYVAFGIELTDASGEPVDSDKIVGGEYTANYGFMDRDCEFVQSSLFGDPVFTAEMTQNDTAVNFTPGDKITLERGTANLDVSAVFLEGSTSRAEIDLTVLRPPKPTAFEGGDAVFRASRLGDYRMPDDAMELHYSISEGGSSVEFGAEEWASFTSESFSTTSPNPDIEFSVEVGKQPGQLFVLPLAPDGDRYRAATGEIPLEITASHVYDEQLNEGRFETSVTIEDDIPLLERLLDWFFSEGWKWLLALLAVIWLLGYFFRRRLPRQLKAKPLVEFRPKSLGGKRAQFSARYEKNRGRGLLPYLPETGLIRPPSQVRGVPSLKVKAAGSGRMEVLNWKAFAQSGKVSFDGEQLTKETKKVRPLRGTSIITVAANDGSYDIQLSQTNSPGKR